ncbi:protein kinase domain-containing protein [Kamptonema formosum]|uniref:protein kinase domain-containing protein n=1 Tax=Kamptonema formosum TaxID=331992 RepID=UPI0003644088|nr:protein kinase [Oscillatoria sp. PCC 10802]
MGKLVILNVVDGDFEGGFTVTLRIETEGERRWLGHARGKLPPRPEIREHYAKWQQPYVALVDSIRSSARISVGGPCEADIAEVRRASKQLSASVDQWLNSQLMFEITKQLLCHLTDKSEEIRFIFQTENLELQQLPWHSWHIFKQPYYIKAETGLYLPVEKQPPATPREKVKVLAVFGNNTGIDTEKDWQALKNHLAEESNAELIRLDQPDLETLCEQLEELSPQIFFFAGHSCSEEDRENGQIELNASQSITIEDLEYELTEAVERGLLLAIFNSCDGLGIARQLAKLHIPNIIVMRESVPDKVAQKFLQRCLEAFAAGKPLHIAVRRAREKMRHLESRFPSATWLPVLFQNPAEPPLTWRGLGGIEIQKPSNQAAQAGEESEIGNQGSILWLPTVAGKPFPAQQQPLPTVVTVPVYIYCPNCGAQCLSQEMFCSQCGFTLSAQQQSSSMGQGSTLLQQQPSTGVGNVNQSQPQQPPAGVGKQSQPVAPMKVANTLASGSAGVGQILGGRYRIIRVLGSGAFGRTYLAEDMQLPGQPPCVVKQLKPASSDPSVLAIAKRLFNTEAEILYKLGTHDQIPRLLAHFEENQKLYLVQEFIDGNDLIQELIPGKPLSEPAVIAILQDVLKILEFVYQQDMIHRDIKPSNLIRRARDGKLVLIDFGAVKEISSQGISAESSIIIGTPGYMPPEQAAGRPFPNSDIYALGQTAIQALTGHSPRQLPEDPQTGEVIWRDRAQVSPPLADIIDKMVRNHPRERYQSATEVLQDLERLTSPPPVQRISPPVGAMTSPPPVQRISHPVGAMTSSPTVPQKQTVWLAWIAAFIAVVLVLAGLSRIAFGPKTPIPENPLPAPEHKR